MEEAPKKSIFAKMCICFGGKDSSAKVEKTDTKQDETVEKEADEAEKPEAENAEASA
jgi:hypothetical protein